MPKTVEIPGVGPVDFPDDMPDAIVSAKAKELYDRSGNAPPQAQVRSRTGQLYTPPTESGSREFVEGMKHGANPMGIVDLIRSAFSDPLGTLGGVAKSPLRMAGGLVTEPAKTLGELTGSLGLGAVTAGAGGILRKAAPSVYELGLNRTPAMKADAPAAAARGIAEGVIPTPGRVQKVLDRAEADVRNPIAAFDRSNPAAIDPLVLSAKGNAAAIQGGKITGRAIKQPALDELSKLTAEFHTENPAPLTAERTLALKRAEQQLADSAYKAEAAGRPIGDADLWHKGMGTAARDQIVRRVPGAEAALSREQELLGLLNGAERSANGASALRHMASVLGGGGIVASGHPISGIALGMLNEAVRNPIAMGAAGLGMDRVGQLLSSPKLTSGATLAQLVQQLTNGPREPR